MKLLLVLLVFTPLVTLVSVSYSIHSPELLLSQCIVTVESGSVGMICVVGFSGTCVSVLVGYSPFCVGTVLVVNV